MNTLVESFFARKDNVVSASILEEMVKQQFSKLLKEDYQSLLNIIKDQLLNLLNISFVMMIMHQKDQCMLKARVI